VSGVTLVALDALVRSRVMERIDTSGVALTAVVDDESSLATAITLVSGVVLIAVALLVCSYNPAMDKVISSGVTEAEVAILLNSLATGMFTLSGVVLVAVAELICS